jgi:hypothetical protein
MATVAAPVGGIGLSGGGLVVVWALLDSSSYKSPARCSNSKFTTS